MIRPGIRRLFRLGLRRRDAIERETEEEIAVHLATRAEELERQGMTPEEAMAEARRRFGELDVSSRRLADAAVSRERHSSVREWIGSVRRDIRYAVRTAVREPGFTAVVVVMIALGVGANAAMFSVVDRLYLSGPEHVVEPDRLTRIYYTVEVPGRGSFSDNTFGYVTYTTMRDQVEAFDGVAAYSEISEGGILGTGSNAIPIRTAHATSDFFDVVGVQPALGRFFNATEDQPGAVQRVVVLGFDTWQTRFGSDRGILGQTVSINGDVFVVLGVMPPGFTGANLSRVDAWLPMSLREPTRDWPTAWDAQWLKVVARLAPGVSRAEAEAEATRAYGLAYAGSEEPFQDATIHAGPIWHDDSGRAPLAVRVSQWLVGVSLVVLLVACANVINLLLARAMRRRRELSVRLALGVSRARLVRQLLTEGVVLAMLGGAAAFLIIPAVMVVARHTLLADVHWIGGVIDARVLAVAVGLTLFVGLLTGLVPALHAVRRVASADLRSGMGRHAPSVSRLRGALAVGQAAASLVLLIGAGLFVRSLSEARNTDMGIEPDRILAVSATWPSAMFGALTPDERRERRTTFYADALREVQELAGVESAAIAVGTPFFSSFSVRLRVVGLDSIPRIPGGGPYVQAVSPGYFETTGLSLRRGRGFNSGDREGSDPVAIVNETMARVLWSEGNAVGQCLLVGQDNNPPCTQVVGVVEDAHRFQLKEQAAMQYYLPLGQEEGFGGSRVLVRPVGEAAQVVTSVREAARQADPSTLWVRVESLQGALDPQLRPWRDGATLIGVFGLLALVIATVGLYSLVAFMVATRTHEIGVRMALGAGQGNVMGLILRTGVGLAAAGLGLGVLVAWASAGQVQDLLFDVSARDPAVYGGAAAALLAAALLACVVPGRRATRVDPVTALRTD